MFDPRQRGSVLLLAVCALLASALTHAAAAEVVVVVRSSDLAPYKAVEESFLANLGQPAKALNLGVGSSKEELRQAVGAALLLFAIGPDAARAVAALKPSAPLIHAAAPSPEKLGLDAKARGIPIYASPSRQASAIVALLPKARKVGIVYDPALSRNLVAEYEAAAAPVGLSIVREEVSARQDVARAVRTLANKVDAIWLVPDTTVISADTFKFMVQTSLETSVPLVGFSDGMAKAGALLSVEASFAEMGRKAAGLAKRLLAGANAAPEPAEGTLYLNANSAELLGVPIPTAVRQQAAKVFE